MSPRLKSLCEKAWAMLTANPALRFKDVAAAAGVNAGTFCASVGRYRPGQIQAIRSKGLMKLRGTKEAHLA